MEEYQYPLIISNAIGMSIMMIGRVEDRRAGEVTLPGLLDGKGQLQAPLVERPDSLEETQLKQLRSDILEQGELIAEVSGGSTHFLGSAVHVPSPLNATVCPQTLMAVAQLVDRRRLPRSRAGDAVAGHRSDRER